MRDGPGGSGGTAQGARGSRVLLLVDAAGDRRVLVSWLRRTHEVIEAASDGALDDDFDLCILDDGAFARLWSRIGERKRRSEPVFLPILLITPHTSIRLLSETPTHDVDEVLEAPVQRGLLVSRVDVLLDRRRHESRLQAEREQALADLRESEAKANALIRYAPTGIYEIDFRPPPRFVSVNDAMAAMSGYSREELLAMSPFDLLDDDSRRLFQERIGQMAAGETPSEDVEYCVIRKDGEQLFVTLNVRFVRDENGVPTGAFVIGHDVTERRRAADALEESRERFEILSDANSLLLSAGDPEGVVQEIAERVMRHLRADVFFNYVLEPGAKRLRLNAWGGVARRVAKMIERLELGQAICGCVARDGERIISADVQHNGDPRADLVRRMGVRCYVCHPLKAGDRTLGTLSFGTKSKDCFDADEIEFMRTVASQVSVAMKRAEAERELAFQSFLLESVSDAVMVYYADEPDKGSLVYVNEAAYAARGYTREEMLRLHVTDLIAPEWRPSLAPRLARLSQGEEVREESAHMRKDGTTFPVEVWLRQISYGGRRLVVNVTRDITERKRDEERLRAELARTSLLQDVAEAAVSVLDLDKLGERVLEAAQRHLGLQAGDIRLLDAAGRRLRLLASVGWPEETRARVADVAVADSGSMASRVVSERRPLTHEDEAMLASPEREEVLREAGVLDSRYLAQPLLFGDRILGAMTFTFAGKRPFTGQEHELFAAVARTVAQAVENSRLFEERTRQARYAEALNRINAAVHSSLEFDEIMDRIVVDVADAMDVDASAIHLHVDDHWEIVHSYGLPEKLRRMRLSDEEARLSTRALETREAVVADDARHDERANRRTVELLAMRAVVAVPLVVRDQAIGVLLAGCTSGTAAFTAEQVDFMGKAAATLALALENARLYQAEHDIADRLQSALLDLPPELPGVEFACEYQSASDAARVGGDFYDLFELDHDHIGIVVGDVAGKGIDAAVLTSMVKNTIRAHASERGKTPMRILSLTNDVVFKATPTESFVTVFLAILDSRDGRVVYANAGHTTAAVVTPQGRVGRLNVTGPLLGGFRDVVFNEAETRLDLGDLLFLYTDGLTEARSDGELYGEERVFAVLSAARGAGTGGLVEQVVADVKAFSGNRLRDDLAILAVRRTEQRPDAPHQQKFEM